MERDVRSKPVARIPQGDRPEAARSGSGKHVELPGRAADAEISKSICSAEAWSLKSGS